MDPRTSLSFVTNSPARLRILRYASDPSTLTELVDGLSYSRPTIRKAANWYVDRGWLRKQDDRYHQTTTGVIFLQCLDEMNEAGGSSVSREDIQFVCSSAVRFDLLHHSLLPVTASDLTDYCNADSTAANRMMAKLVARGWYERDGYSYRRTAAGDAVHATITYLLAVLEQLTDKQPLFDRLPTDLADLPVTALNGANSFTPADGPDAALTALKQLGDGTASGPFDHIRTVCPIYRPTIISTLREFISFSTRTEIVLDQPTFRHLCTPEQWPVLGAMVAHPYTDVRIYPDDLSFGVGTYDEQSMISTYNDHPGNVAGVASADEEIVGWMGSTIDDYWRRSQPVSEKVTNKLGKYADTSSWGVSSTMMWGASDEDQTASAMLYDFITP